MTNIKISVKNYRCFDDSNPLTFNIGAEFVALVGPNNSGKSSCLKFFYELRQLWDVLNSQNHIINLLNQMEVNVNYNGVTDTEEVFNDSNERDMSIEVEIFNFEAKTYPVINRVKASASKHKNVFWKCDFYNDGNINPIRSDSVQFETQNRIIQTSTSRYDYSEMFMVFSLLAKSLYIGPYRNCINEGAGAYFDLAIGSNFIDTWNLWKTGGIKYNSRAIETITNNIKDIFGYESLEINASTHLKTLVVSINGKQYKISELGAGLAQFIIVFGNAAIKKPSFILIDEPELHLHPSLQIDFLTSLASYASVGLVYATHSIGLARSTADKIYSLQKINNNTLLKPFEQTTNYVEFVGEMSFSTFKELGFNSVLLVEGVSDVKVIQQFLRKMKKDHKVLLIPLGGNQLAKGGVEHELQELKRISNSIYAIVDSEREDETASPVRERLEFEELCKKIGISVLLTNYRAIENYFSDYAVKAIFGEKYRALKSYELLRSMSPSWSKNDNWKIAREMNLSDIENTDVGVFLKNL